MDRGSTQWDLSLDQYRDEENDFGNMNAELGRRCHISGGSMERDSLSEPFKRLGALSWWDQCTEDTSSIETRRACEAFRQEALPRIQLFKRVVEKYFVQRAGTQRVSFALHKWQRAAQIVSSLGSYHALIRRHRAFYLRKVVLQTCWSHVSHAFLQWQQFMDQSARALRAIAGSYERQLKRLVLGKWYHRLLLAGRLEEQAVANVWMRRSYQQTRAVERKLKHTERQLLVSYWVNWRASIRESRYRHSSRRMLFQNRWIFVDWKRFVTSRKDERERSREPVRAIVDELIFESVYQAQVKQAWVTKAERLCLALHILERIVAAYQRQKTKESSFRTWRAASAVGVAQEPLKSRAEPQAELRKIRLPERISALFRRSRALETRVSKRRVIKHRPQWR